MRNNSRGCVGCGGCNGGGSADEVCGGVRDIAGRRIVPVRYSDSFFSLLPGESRLVRFERPQNLNRVRTACWND